MTSNMTTLGVQGVADFKDLISDLKSTATNAKTLNKELAKMVNQLTSVTAAMAGASNDMKKLSQENHRLNKAKREQFLTNKKLMNSETLLSAIYTKNSAIAQKKYLHSITGLRAGLERFRAETHRVMVVERGHVTLLDEQTNAMKRFMIMGNMVSRTLDNMATRMLNTGKNMQWTGRQMMVGITLPLVGVAAGAMRASKAAAVVDRQLKRVVEGGSKALAVLNESAIELSNTWGVNVENIKAMQVQFAQAGFSGAQIKDLARQTQEFSVIGDVAAESAQSLVQALALTGKTGADLTETLARLNLIDDETSLSMQDVADALPKIVPLFKAYGGTVEEAAALLAAFTDNSIDAVEGANTLKAVLTRLPAAMAGLSDPNLGGTRLKGLRESLELMERMTGIDMKLLDDEGKVRGSLDVLVQVSAAARELKKTGEGENALKVITRELFGAQQASRGTALFDELSQVGDVLESTTGNANGLAKAMTIAHAKGGDLNKVLEEYERQKKITLDDPWLKFQAGVQKLRNIAIDFGLNQVLPVAGQLLEKITGLIERFQRLSKGTKDLIVKFALAAAALGPLIYILGQFTIMGATLGKMLFTKPLKAIFHLGQSFRGLKPEAQAAKEAIDALSSDWAEGKITREQLKLGVEKEMRAAGVMRMDAERALRQEVNKTTAAVVTQAEAVKASSAAVTQAATATARGRVGGTAAALGPMYGPPAPEMSLDDIRKKYPDIYNKVVGHVPGGRDAVDPLQVVGEELSKRVSVVPKLNSPAGAKAAKEKVGALRKALREANRRLQPKFLDPLLASVDDDYAALKSVADQAGETAKGLKLTKARWEKYVPVLIKHSDISVNQLNDAKELDRIIGGIEKHLPKNQYGAPISSGANIRKVLANSQIAGPNSLNVRETFPGARGLRVRLEQLIKTGIPGAEGVGGKGFRGAMGDIGFPGADRLMPRGLMAGFAGTYKSYIVNAMMEDADDSLVDGVNQTVRDRITALKADLESGAINEKEFKEKFWRASSQSKTMQSKINSLYAKHMTDLFDKYKATPDEGKKLGRLLQRKIKARGAKGPVSADILHVISSEIAQGNNIGELLRSGKIPKSVLDEVASSLYTGDDLGNAVTRIYKEAGLVKRVDPSQTVKAMKARGMNPQQIRQAVKGMKTSISRERAVIASSLRALQQEMLVGGGMEKGMAARLSHAGKEGGITGFVPGADTFDDLDRQIGRGDVQGLYEKRIAGLNSAIETNSRKKAESMREWRSRVGRIRRREVRKLTIERDRLAKEFAQATADFDRLSTTFDPNGQLLLDGKPTTQAAVDAERRRMTDRAFQDPKRVGIRQQITQKANYLVGRRQTAQGGPILGPPKPPITPLDVGKSSLPQGATKAIGATKDLRSNIVKIEQRMDPLWRKDLFSGRGPFAFGKIAKSTREAGRLSKGFKNLGGIVNQLTGAFTGMAVVGQGGMLTLLGSAMSVIAPLALIAAAAFFIKKNWDEVGPHIVDGLSAIKDAGRGLFKAIVDPFKDMFGIVDEGGAKGKSMSETWESVGVLMNRVLHLISGSIRVLAVAIKPVATVMAAVSLVVVSLFNAFGMLPSKIQLVVAAFVLLQFTAVRAAMASLVNGLAVLLYNLVGIPRAAKMAAMGMSMMQVAMAGLLVAITLGAMKLQEFKRAAQDGTNAANEFHDAVAQREDLGPQQSIEDAADAYAREAAEYHSLLAEYEEAKGNQGGFRMPGTDLVFGGNEGEQKRALALEARLTSLLARTRELETEFNNQTRTVRVLGSSYSITEKQIQEFAAANNIDLRLDSNDTIGKFREKWLEAHTDINGNPLMPEVDLTQAQAALDDLEATLSEFDNQMRKAMDGWKEAALEGFDAWADQQIETIDNQIEAIQKLTKVEEEESRKREYLRRKEELALKRRQSDTKYNLDRRKAIYEGRYDDAAILDIDHASDTASLDQEGKDLEADRQKELTRMARDAEIERLNNLKDSKKKELDLQKEALQDQLDEITKFEPRNAQAARNMQNAILSALGERTGDYGTLAAKQHKLWKGSWDSAWAETHLQMAERAYKAGRATLDQFSKGMGVEATPATGDFEGQLDEAIRTGVRPEGAAFHTGGSVGNPAASPQDVDATLQTGEFVVQRKAVAKYGTKMLTDLNEGQIYHSGGPVGMPKAARRGLGKFLHNAVDSFRSGTASIGGMTIDQVHNAYRNALSGSDGSGGSTLGKSIAEIVDNMISGIHPEFKKRLDKWNKEMGGKFDTSHGYRTMAQQQALYNRWINRVPGQAQAAPPGRSMHNFGLAVDLQPSRTTAAQRAAGAKYGLRWPMSFEPWHVEPVEARAWKDQILNGSMPGGGLDSGGIRAIAGLFGPGTGGATGGDAKSIVKGMMAQYGFSESTWPSLEKLIQGESGWNPNAANPTSSARGLFQKMTSIHGPIESTIAGQAQWGLNYIKQRYGDPASAFAKWSSRNPHWYHDGGLAQLRDGGRTLSDGIAKMHKKETVLTEPLSAELINGIRNLSSGGETHVHLEIGNFLGSDREIEKLGRELERVMIKVQRKKGTVSRTFSKG